MNPNRPTANIRSAQPIKLPVGHSEFAELITGGFTFVDKTLLIEEIVQSGAKVTLITRPRRFGKTLNLSMLQHFFAQQVRGNPTQRLFDGLAIASRAAAMAHQGKYPVIFFTFKDIRPKNLEEFQDNFRGLLAALCNGYPELLDSPRLTERDRTVFRALVDKQADETDTRYAFRLLAEMLSKHYGQQVVILLDEYDTPIHNAFMHGFYEDLIDPMRDLLGAALKDNPYLFKGIVTGILRIGKENLFSGLNNPEVATVLDAPYSRHFGFTETEVAGLLAATGLSARKPKLEAAIKDWYNGYRCGAEVIYNPWSIVNCLSSNGKLDSFWANTSGSGLLKKFMASADAHFKQDLERLISGESVQETVDPTLAFEALGSDGTTLWSLMLFSGYLTALATEPATGRQKRCTLTIPNREIRYEYDHIIQSWFSGPNESAYRDMLASLIRGDAESFEAALREYLLACASMFDAGGRHPEKFYHGLVLGMMVGLKETHVIGSNRESGDGRFDLALFPKDLAQKNSRGSLGLILEFKQTRDPKKLKATAKAALAQIDRRRYETELGKHRVKRILAIGLAFSGKSMVCAYAERAVGRRVTGQGVKRTAGAAGRARGAKRVRRAAGKRR